ncbi:hypothetical protein FPQ18DRAFT_303812 [Pyronema domesticum]|nr:hypothetical protein FPQ18DRAFT_303812 [Pyronema domesticum]
MAYFLPILISALMVCAGVIGLLYLHIFLREFPALYRWLPFRNVQGDQGAQGAQEQGTPEARGNHTAGEIHEARRGMAANTNDPNPLALARERAEKIQGLAELNARFDRVIDLALEGAARIHRGEKVSGVGSVEYDLWVEQQGGKAAEGAAGSVDGSFSGSAANANCERIGLVDIYRVEFFKNEAGEIVKKEITGMGERCNTNGNE